MKLEKIYIFFSMLILFCIPIEPLIGIIYKILQYMFIFFFLVVFVNWIKKTKKLNPYYILFIIFIIVCLFSIIYSADLDSSTSMARQLVLNFLLAAGISFIIREQNDLKYAENIINRYLLCFTLGTLVITLYLLLFEAPNLNSWERLGEKLYLNYGSHMVFSYCLIISITYLIWDIFFSKNEKTKKIFLSKLIILIILGIGAFISGTRKTIICPAIFTLLCIFVKYRKNWLKLSISTFIVLVAIFSIYKIMMSNQELYNRIGIRIERMINLYKSGSTEEGSLNERKKLRNLSIELFKQNPIAGYGLHAFRQYSVNHGGAYLYSHCNYTELLADLGIIGFISYYGAYLYLLLLAVRKLKTRKLSVPIVAFLIMNLISDYSTVSYYRHYYLIVFFLFATYLSNSDKKNLNNMHSKEIEYER